MLGEHLITNGSDWVPIRAGLGTIGSLRLDLPPLRLRHSADRSGEWTSLRSSLDGRAVVERAVDVGDDDGATEREKIK